jgi:ABC-2 type transport system ATP-binding protein
MKTNNITIRNLTKRLDGNIILDNINVTFDEGIIYGIVGRNGSGKSMLFKSICGFLTPTDGIVMINGEDIYKLKTFPQDVRALINKPTFISSISGFENLKILSEIQKKIDSKKILDTLNIVNLLDESNKKYGKYSLGMKQKLGIAAVIMEDPKIIILDEPFNGIDNESVKKIKLELIKIKSNKIIILATHIEQDLSDLCDEIYMMDCGKISKTIK